MNARFRVLPGLPAYGPAAIAFPERFAQSGREGFVVEFLPGTPDGWVGNFEPGWWAYEGVHSHPDGQHVVVVAAGNGYVVDPNGRKLLEEVGPINLLWERAGLGLIADRQGLAFFCIGPSGLRWHTRRLSWDGFRSVDLGVDALRGEAWSPIDDAWKPFEVDLSTSRSLGGAFDERDSEKWEVIADAI